MKLTHDYAGTFLFYQSARDVSAGTSTIKFGGGAASTPCNGGILSYPLGMLVGCRLTFSAASNGFVLDDNTTTGRVYTIIAHELDTVTKLTITPALVNTVTGSGGDDDSRSDAGSSIIIHSYKLPSADVNMAVAAGANASNESVLTDQFLGIASTVTLPETKIDLKRYHVVGLGRDVAVQVPGRFTNEGGSFEVNMHNPRWLYYALGMEAIDINSVGAGGGQFDTLVDVESTGVLSTGVVSAASNTAINVDTVDATTKFNIGESLYDDAGAFVGLITNVVSGTITLAANNITEIGNNENLKRVAQRLNGATEVGESRITYDGGAPDFLGGTDPVAVGDYVILKDISTTDIVTYKASDSGNTFGVVSNPEHNYFDKTETSEIRRIVGITATDIWLDDGLSFPHADNLPLRFARFNTGSTQGSPDRAAATGTLTNGVTRLLYSRSTVPSFAMEVSIRRNDTADSGTATTEVTDGSSTDAKTLTRVFRGCKVKDFSITADTDAALRMNVNFDAALCYTDTGRLEGLKPQRLLPLCLKQEVKPTLVF